MVIGRRYSPDEHRDTIRNRKPNGTARAAAASTSSTSSTSVGVERSERPRYYKEKVGQEYNTRQRKKMPA